MPLLREGVLLVVSGPSGVGKGTVIERVLTRQRQAGVAVRRSVSCTTRPPREGERDGVHYHFISPEQFARMRDAGELLEWATVHQDLLYGTPREPVERALRDGDDIVLEIDYQGAMSVREAMGDRAVLVFVAPPSWGALVERLVGRNTESEQAVSKRTRSARVELSNMHRYEYIIVNEEVEQAAAELEAILVAERDKTTRADWQGLQARLLEESGP